MIYINYSTEVFFFPYFCIPCISESRSMLRWKILQNPKYKLGNEDLVQLAKQYLPIDLKPGEVSEILTSIGLEVEAMEQFHSVRGGLEGVVVGEVISCKKHPNADKLTLTEVDVGNEKPLR
jgi:hypothetical protein